jgi:hypothetical protein
MECSEKMQIIDPVAQHIVLAANNIDQRFHDSYNWSVGVQFARKVFKNVYAGRGNTLSK